MASTLDFVKSVPAETPSKALDFVKSVPKASEEEEQSPFMEILGKAMKAYDAYKTAAVIPKLLETPTKYALDVPAAVAGAQIAHAGKKADPLQKLSDIIFQRTTEPKDIAKAQNIQYEPKQSEASGIFQRMVENIKERAKTLPARQAGAAFTGAMTLPQMILSGIIPKKSPKVDSFFKEMGHESGLKAQIAEGQAKSKVAFDEMEEGIATANKNLKTMFPSKILTRRPVKNPFQSKKFDLSEKPLGVIKAPKNPYELINKRWTPGTAVKRTRNEISAVEKQIATDHIARNNQLALFNKSLKSMGVDPATVPGVSDEALSGLNATEAFAKIDAAHSTTLTTIPAALETAKNAAARQTATLYGVRNIITKRLNTAGVSGVDALKMLRGEIPLTPELQPLKPLVDRMSNVIHTMAKNKGHKIGKLDDYIPTMRRLKVHVANPDKVVVPSLKQQQMTLGDLIPSTVKHRAKLAKLPKEVYEDDLLKLIDRRIWETHVEALLTPERVAQINYNRAILGLKGKTKELNYLMDYVKRTTGLSTSSTYEAPIEALVSSEGQQTMQRIRDVVDAQQPGMGKQLLRDMNKVMFSSWIGANPTAHIKQILQPMYVGSPEIGIKSVLRGMKLAAKTPSKYKAVSARFKRIFSKPGSIRLLESNEDVQALSGFHKGIDKMTQALMKGFTGLDRYNRSAISLGVYDDILRNGPKAVHLEGLLPGQAQYVQEGLKGGIKEFAFRAGLMRTLRVNYIYSIFDKPQLLANALGEAIPFTTWSRNTINRMVGDAMIGNTTLMAKRLAYPLMMREAIIAATGYDVPNSLPIQAATGAFDLQPYPAVTGFIDRPDKALQHGASLIPGEQRIVKTLTRGPVEGLTGLRQGWHPGLLQVGLHLLNSMEDTPKPASTLDFIKSIPRQEEMK